MSNTPRQHQLDRSEFRAVTMVSGILCAYLALDVYFRTEVPSVLGLALPAVVIVSLLCMQVILLHYYSRRSAAIETLFTTVDIDSAFAEYMHLCANEIHETEGAKSKVRVLRPNMGNDDIKQFQDANAAWALELRRKAEVVLNAGRELNLMTVYSNVDAYAKHPPMQKRGFGNLN